MQRIMIVGRPGSGKSRVPVYHLDRYFFLPNWIEREEQDFLDMQQNMVAGDAWIIDGNCLESLEMRYQRATLCLYFNYPVWLCVWRVFKRRFNKDQSIQDRPDACKEVIRFSFLKYIWNFDQRIRPILQTLRQEYPEVQFLEIKGDIDLEQRVTNWVVAILHTAPE